MFDCAGKAGSSETAEPLGLLRLSGSDMSSDVERLFLQGDFNALSLDLKDYPLGDVSI